MIQTVVCSKGSHAVCPSTKCQCPCHLEDSKKAERVKEAREVAHLAVMHFDHGPSRTTAQAAVIALNVYLEALNG